MESGYSLEGSRYSQYSSKNATLVELDQLILTISPLYPAALERQVVCNRNGVFVHYIAHAALSNLARFFTRRVPMKKSLFLTIAFALAATFVIAQETSTPKDPTQQNNPAAQTKPDDKSTAPAQETTGA